MACEGEFGVTLESLFAYDGNFVATLGSFCGHYWHLRAALGTLWVTLEVTLGVLAAYGGDVGATLGLSWDQFGVSLGICGRLWVTCWSFCNDCRVTLGI